MGLAPPEDQGNEADMPPAPGERVKACRYLSDRTAALLGRPEGAGGLPSDRSRPPVALPCERDAVAPPGPMGRPLRIQRGCRGQRPLGVNLDYESGPPQFPQNFIPGADVWPHRGQECVAGNGWPQLPQNFVPGGFGA